MTIEEAAREHAEGCMLKSDYQYDYKSSHDGFIAGARFMQEQSQCETQLPQTTTQYPFARLWELYEKKGNKKTSERKWSKLKDRDRAKCIEVVPSYVAATPDKKYRKNLETFLNQECYNDDLISTNYGTNKQLSSGISTEDVLRAIAEGAAIAGTPQNR